MNTTFKSALFSGLFLSSLAATSTHALEFDYSGAFVFCTSSCDTFDAFGAQSGGAANTINSQVSGFIDLPINANNTFEFTDGDNVAFEFWFSNAAVDTQPPVIGPDASCAPPNVPGQICNFGSVNPLPLNNSVGRLSGSGAIGSNGLPQSGTLIFAWNSPPFSNNSIALRIDLTSGTGTASLFGGVIDFFEFDGAFTTEDSDADGFADTVDNCINRSNTNQRDSDGDGYGNRCDSDLDNNCFVNVLDLGLLRNRFFSSNADADFNGDNTVNFIDLGILRTSFFSPPGPSAQSDACSTP